ncbi:MAG TPA: methyltransferase, partial [Spirochaetia bacterium]|nr:methyltransferase [Spirochaetia bacterium]
MLFEAERVLKKDGLLVIVDYQMDKKTNRFAKKLIGFIEWVAGKT